MAPLSPGPVSKARAHAGHPAVPPATITWVFSRHGAAAVCVFASADVPIRGVAVPGGGLPGRLLFDTMFEN